MRGVSIHPSGSIPACAGEPLLATGQRIPRRVYPRVCGGTPQPGLSLAGIAGLSPRVRGNPPEAGDNRVTIGSIPACAGEPSEMS